MHRQSSHIKPLLKKLHWLPIQNSFYICCEIITGTALQYLAEPVLIYPFSSRLVGISFILQIIGLFASPPSKENSMVFMPSTSLLHKSGIHFLSLSTTALPALKINLKTYLFKQYFDQKQIIEISFTLIHSSSILAFKLVLRTLSFPKLSIASLFLFLLI